MGLEVLMGRRKRTQPRDAVLEALAAAYLSSQGNDQAAIAGVLGVSQGEVSRLLAVARREGWLQTRCVLPEGAVRVVEQAVFSGRRELGEALRREAERHGAPPVRGVRIYHSGSEAEDPAGWDE